MLHFILNPKAHGGSEELFATLDARLRTSGVPYTWFRAEKMGDIEEYVGAIGAGETVIAVGGDGTLNIVLRALQDPASVTLGLIPAGTGNDFAAAAGIPVGAAALDLILNGTPKYTDYLECGNGLRSMNIAGLGIDVDILERCERKKKNGKKASYFKSLLASLCKFKALKMLVTADGESTEYRALIAAACNGRQFGGGIPICPPAVIDDGKLDLVVIECPKRIKLPYYLVLLMKGKVLTRSVSHHILCEEVRIVPENAGSVQLDGELVPAGELDVRVVSGKLKMYRG